MNAPADDGGDLRLVVAELTRERDAALGREAALAEVLALINRSSDDPEPVFELILEKAHTLCGAAIGALSIYDGTLMHTLAMRGFPDDYAARMREPWPPPEATTGRLIDGADVVHIPDAAVIGQGFGFMTGRSDMRTTLVVPLRKDNAFLGQITAFRPEVRPFSEEQIALLRGFAAQAVIALENARLVGALRQRTDQLARRNTEYSERIDHQAATIDVLKAMSASPGDPRPVFDLIAVRARDVCGAYGVTVYEFDGTLIHRHAATGVSDDPTEREAAKADYPLPPARDRFAGRAILDRAIVHIRDHRTEPGLLWLPHLNTAKSSVTVPVMRDGVPIGALSMGSRETGGFTDTQVELLKTFAEQAAIAITSAETFRALQHRTADLQESLEYQTATSDVLKAISRSTFDLQPVLDTLITTAARLCEAENAFLMEREGDLFRAKATFAVSPPAAAILQSLSLKMDRGTITGRAALKGRAVQIEDVTTDPDYALAQTVSVARNRTLLSVPLLRQGVVVGAITLGRQRVQTFTDQQIALVGPFADQAVIAIENTRLLTEQREALEQQTATAEVLRVINASPGDLAPVFETILEKAMRLCGVAFGLLREFDGERLRLLASRGVPVPFAEFLRTREAWRPLGGMGEALRTGISHQWLDVRDDPHYIDGVLGIRAIADLGGARTLLQVPMVKDGGSIGLFTFFRNEVRAFTNKEIALLESFAAQAVIAMENARLLTETREALEQQTATAEVLGVINASPGDLAPVFDTVLDKASRLCGATIGGLFSLEGNRSVTLALRGVTPGFAAFQEQFPIDEIQPGTVPARIIETRRPVQSPDVKAGASYRDGVPFARAMVDLGNIRAVLAVPLLRDGIATGMIALYREEPGAFADKQIALLENFAAQAVIAMENARLITETREALEQQTATAEVLRVINASPGNLQPVFDTMLEKAHDLCGTPLGGLMIWDGTHIRAVATHGFSEQFAARLRRGFPPSRASQSLLDGARLFHIPDAMADAPDPRAQGVQETGARTTLLIPLRKDGEFLGYISSFRKEVRPFSDKEIALLENFAAQAVIAMENARLLTETREALEQQTATAELLRIINESPGDPQPVFDAMLEKATLLCGVAFGFLATWDGTARQVVAVRGLPPAVREYAATRVATTPSPSVMRVLETARPYQSVDLMDDDGYREGHPDSRMIVDLGGVRTCVHVPLVKDDATIGYFSFYRREVSAFSGKEIALMESFAAQAVIAMENARLLSELRERTAELAERNAAFAERIDHQAATIDVLKEMSASPADAQPVFDLICDQARALLGTPAVTLFEYDGTLVHLRARSLSASFADPVSLKAYSADWPRVPDRGSLSCRAILDRAVIHVRDMDAEPSVSSEVRALGSKTQVVIPLMRDGRAIGAISTGSTRPDGVSDTQIELLKTFAEQAVIAIGSAETYRALQDRTAALARRNSEFGERIEQQAATIDVLKVMSSTPDDTQPVFDQIVRRARELCNAPSAALFQFDGELVHYRARALPDGFDESAAEFISYRDHFPMAPDPGSLTCQAILDKRVIHVRDLETEPGLPAYLRDIYRRTGLRSQVTVPLLRDGAALGAITLNALTTNGFSDSQIALLQTFAEQAVIAIGSVATFRALRERTDELARRQNELSVTFENMGDGVAMFDETQRLVAWNRRFQDIIEVPDDVIAQRRTFPDYIRYLAERGEYGPDADPEEQIRRLTETIGQRRAYERTRPNGTVIEIRNNPVASGGFVIIYADITERKRAETAIRAARDAAETALRDLQTAQDRLIQAEKMASLGQLTAGIAHEIKNPLNFVNNFASLSVELLDELKETAAPAFATLDGDTRADVEDLTETLTGNLKKIEEHGKRADAIVRSMLEHSRGSSGEHRAVDLNELVDEALNLAFHGARARDQSFNITLERDFAAAIAPIEVNPQDLTRVFLNLVSNGFYAANKRAKDGTATGFAPVLKASTRDLGHAVEIRVRDNGTGIPDEIRDKLFQPFFTTKPTGEGTGLGLSITYDIVTKQHRGTIAVESRVGSFTEFIVTIPREPRLGGGAP